MKIGVISDVHSNIQALRAVLDVFDEEKVDQIICCGDVIGIGINPDEVIQELMKRKDKFISVIGNHEQYFLQGLPKTIHDDKRSMSDMEIQNHEWNHGRISEESKEFLKTFSLTQSITVEGKRIYVIHYPMKEDGTFKTHIKHPSFSECLELFQGVDSDIYLYGHTHTYHVNHEEDKWFINVGSLGCPVGTDTARAGILEITKEDVQFRPITVSYHVEEIIDEINQLKFPFYEKILEIFYGVEK